LFVLNLNDALENTMYPNSKLCMLSIFLYFMNFSSIFTTNLYFLGIPVVKRATGIPKAPLSSS